MHSYIINIYILTNRNNPSVYTWCGTEGKVDSRAGRGTDFVPGTRVSSTRGYLGTHYDSILDMSTVIEFE